MKTILTLILLPLLVSMTNADWREETFQTVEPTAEELYAWHALWEVCEFPWTGNLASTNEILLDDAGIILREGDQVVVEWDSINCVVRVNGQSIMDAPPLDPNDDDLRPERPEKYAQVPFVQALAGSIPDLAERAELYLKERRRLKAEANAEYVRMMQGGSESDAAMKAAELMRGSPLVAEAWAEKKTGPDGRESWFLVTEWHGYRASHQPLGMQPPLAERRPATRKDACYYLHRIQEMCIVPSWGTSLRTNCTFALNHKSSSLQDR